MLGVCRVISAAGLLIFVATILIGQTTEKRILGTHTFDQATSARPYAIEMKGRVYFVEREYGWRYDLSQHLLLAAASCMIFAGAAAAWLDSERKSAVNRRS